MAIVVLYDDSDGWYDHQMGPIVNQAKALNPVSGHPMMRCLAQADWRTAERRPPARSTIRAGTDRGSRS